MRLWSRGLGRTEVLMDFRYYEIARDPATGEVVIFGRMRDPVDWEFRITLGPDDVPGLIKTFFNTAMIRLVAGNLHRYAGYLLHRKKFQDSPDLEDRVNAAYDQVMHGRRPGRQRLSRNGGSGDTPLGPP